MYHWPLINEQTGIDLFRDNETYSFAEINRRSNVGRTTLERKREAGVLWVYRNRPTWTRGDWVKYALRHNQPRPLPKDLKSVVLTPPGPNGNGNGARP